MKKIALTSLLAVFVMSGANAATNYFIGGSASFEGAKDEHNTAWSVMPEFGWHLNDKWDAGLAVGMMYDNSNVAFDQYTYGAEGFARYKIAEFGAFNVLLDGRAGVYAQTLDGEKTNTWWVVGAEVSPMVTYNLSESFTLYAKLNFLGASAEYAFKNDDANTKSDWTFAAFGDSSDAFNTKDFQIGFYYNF